MNIVVADSSVLRDMERGGLLEQCLSLPYRFTVPDLLFKNELARHWDKPDLGESLLALGLQVEELDGNEVSNAILFRRERPRLSLPGAFSLALASGRKWLLLTCDRVLRAFAAKLSVGCHGVLWLLDQLFDAGFSSPADLIAGLTSIRGHPRCRLPVDEIAMRTANYSSPSGTH